jgi:naphthoate synthase
VSDEWTDWAPGCERVYESILYDKRFRRRGGGVARIRFNRPERMNSYDIPMGNEVIHALLDANRDNSIGVIVLTHVGDHFGVGGNVQLLSDNADSTDMIMGGTTADTVIGRCHKPVIAAIRGYSIGMHNHLAYHCDLTIAGESAVFGQSGPRVGSPVSGSLVGVSVNVVGSKRARRMWMLTEQLTAQEALEWGLVNFVVQDRLIDEHVERICGTILDRVPSCIAAIKQTFEGVNAPLLATNAVMDLVDPRFAERAELAEAGTSFFEKRPPNFWTDEMMDSRF